MTGYLAKAALCASALFALCAPAHAATVIGGSDLLTPTHAAQMETWLTGDPQLAYSGPLTFTNIFDKAPGDTSTEFHAAADGMGPTFFVVEATDIRNPGVTQIIGGYNPVSWRSDDTWTDTPAIEDRLAFLFNLVMNEVRQQSNHPAAHYQTYNGGFGPTFGAGTDLLVNADLMGGSAVPGGYCLDTTVYCNGGTNIMGNSNNAPNQLIFGALEVFTISAVPIPAAAPLLLGALGLTGWIARRRKG